MVVPAPERAFVETGVDADTAGTDAFDAGDGGKIFIKILESNDDFFGRLGVFYGVACDKTIRDQKFGYFFTNKGVFGHDSIFFCQIAVSYNGDEVGDCIHIILTFCRLRVVPLCEPALGNRGGRVRRCG
jgi:hypothetical protein